MLPAPAAAQTPRLAHDALRPVRRVRDACVRPGAAQGSSARRRQGSAVPTGLGAVVGRGRRRGRTLADRAGVVGPAALARRRSLRRRRAAARPRRSGPPGPGAARGLGASQGRSAGRHPKPGASETAGSRPERRPRAEGARPAKASRLPATRSGPPGITRAARSSPGPSVAGTWASGTTPTRPACVGEKASRRRDL